MDKVQDKSYVSHCHKEALNLNYEAYFQNSMCGNDLGVDVKF